MEDLTAKTLMELHEQGKLGYVEIEVPNCQKTTVFNTSTRTHHYGDVAMYYTLPFIMDKIIDSEIDMESIESMVVTGSVLHKHSNPEKKKTINIFGKEIVISTYTPAMEIDNITLDLVILNNQGINGDEVLKPYSWVEEERLENFLGQTVLEEVKKTKSPGNLIYFSPHAFESFSSPFINLPWDVSLHYRPDDFSDLDDPVIRAAVEYGVPIMGINNFNRLVEGIQEPKRNPLHTAVYSNRRGNLNVEIVPKQ